MIQGPLLIDTSRQRKLNPLPAPTLLITLEPRGRTFFRNLKDLLWHRSKAPLVLVSRPASFWPDVFVASPLPWSRFLQSALAHLALIAVMFGWTRFAPQLWPQPTQIVQRNIFHSSDVVYYDATEYLPPLNTGGTQSPSAKKGEPEHATQPIISVPPESDNRAQTIVTPPNVKLDHDVPLPNIVAWAHPQPTIPAAAVADSPSNLKLPVFPTNVIPPAPDVNNSTKQSLALQQAVVAPAPEMNGTIARRDVSAPQPSIVEPPREVENSRSSRLADINIGHAQVVAPAPQLPVGEQRAASMVLGGKSHAAVVPPPPSLQGSGTSRDGRMIALNLHPTAPGRPAEVPAGNRRGTFAATPDGKAGAAGTPDIPAQNHRAVAGGNSAGSSGKASGVPPGLYVGANPNAESTATMGGGTNARTSDNSTLLANAKPPRVTAAPPRSSEMPANAESEVERKLFGGRKSYAMTLNVPNLNSAGGSWVMHFAELKDAEKQGELVAPVATQEVDPGYPLELMRQQIRGTVILSAIIHSNGSVSDVKIVRGVDDRLDQYASAALSRWRFRPATKNGDPIALQTVVMIPFQPMRKSAF
jgi:TonB family protein